MNLRAGVRKLIGMLWVTVALTFCAPALAVVVSDLSSKDAASGLKEALARGVDIAIG